jgi:hypothetical protein
MTRFKFHNRAAQVAIPKHFSNGSQLSAGGICHFQREKQTKWQLRNYERKQSSTVKTTRCGLGPNVACMHIVHLAILPVWTLVLMPHYQYRNSILEVSHAKPRNDAHGT